MGIGISSPGPFDPWRGVVLETPNMGPDFVDVPITASLGDAFGLPAFLDRDTNVAALGEMAFGAARGCADFIYLTVSTGVGGAIVSEGRIFHGPGRHCRRARPHARGDGRNLHLRRGGSSRGVHRRSGHLPDRSPGRRRRQEPVSGGLRGSEGSRRHRGPRRRGRRGCRRRRLPVRSWSAADAPSPSLASASSTR